MLYADNQIAPCRKHISQERILGISDRIALANYCQRKLRVASAGPHLVIPPHREIDDHRPLALSVKKFERVMSDAPLLKAIYSPAKATHRTPSTPNAFFIVLTS